MTPSSGRAVGPPFETTGPIETARFGERLGALLRPGDVIGFSGPLGAGKTCLIQGLARTLGVPDEQCVRSPTFIILNEYSGRFPLYHFDLYRIGSLSELEEIGFRETLDGEGVSVIEWADRVTGALPGEHLMIRMEHRGGDHRRISLSATGKRYRAVLDALGPSPEPGTQRGRG